MTVKDRWPVIVLGTTTIGFWGLSLLFSSSPINVGPIHETAGAFGRWGAATIYLITFVCAVYALARNSVWFLLPQQSILIASAIGVLYTVEVGQFADGNASPRLLIASGAILWIGIAVVHLAVMVMILAAMDAPEKLGDLSPETLAVESALRYGLIEELVMDHPEDEFDESLDRGIDEDDD